MMDVLYVLGNGSRFDNLEFRLSLRSLEKHAQNLGRVFICGYKPDWIQNVVHIPCDDPYQREKNVFNKMLKACDSDISNDFLFMNDDFYMVQDFNCESYPYFVNGDVVFIDNPSRYQKIQNKTLRKLQSMGFEKVLDFRAHCPMRINKQKFKQLNGYFVTTLKDECGYSPRLLYGTMFADWIQRAPDCKIWNLVQLQTMELPLVNILKLYTQQVLILKIPMVN